MPENINRSTSSHIVSASDFSLIRNGQLFLSSGLGWLLALIPLSICLYLLSWQEAVASGQQLRMAYEWIPSLGVNLSWQLDGLSLIFSMLITGIGTLVLIYAGAYLAGDKMLGRLYLYLLLFMVAMLGLVLSANLLTLFIFWELTSITSYLLIGYKHRYESSRNSALQALLVTGGGGLALLVGVLLLGQVVGTLEISELIAASSAIQGHSLYPAVVLLILAGAFTKSAQFPFHFWLPNAMAAPTPVSAYLHSATMVKAGVYLVARMTPVLGGTALWFSLLTGFGLVTMVMAAFLAWRQTDLKRILAYTTISALGMLIFLLGIGTVVAFKAALVFLLAHAFYKGALFMIAGAVEHQTGTREIDKLGGLWRVLPFTGFAAALAALSMSGLPPFTGFVSKELFYEATLGSPLIFGVSTLWLFTGAAVLANVLTVLAAGLAVLRPFSGSLSEPFSGSNKRTTEAGVGLLIGPWVLAGAGLFGGLFITMIGQDWIGPAVSAVVGESVSVKLSLWHGVNAMLILSAVTIGVAVLVWFRRDQLLTATASLDVGRRYGPERGYQRFLVGMPALATRQTNWIQHGYLRSYLIVIVSTVVVLVGGTLLTQTRLTWPNTWSVVNFFELGILGLMLVTAGLAITSSSRMLAIVSVGVVGLGMTLLFVFYSAPDLAMTQFAVETLTVLLFVFVLYRLPHFQVLTDKRERLRDGALALMAGTLMATLVLVAIAAPHPMHVSEYFAAESWLQANGRNVVNVILVDFRALDTLGEVVVLMIAALGVHALVWNVSSSQQPEQSVNQSPAGHPVVHSNRGLIEDRSVILQTSTRYLLPLLLLFSFFLLLRGHNEPGGGFVGGLVAAAAIALYGLSAGVDKAQALLRVDLRTLMGAGLLCAVGAGLIGLMAQNPLLYGLWWKQPIPVVGKLGTPLLFDIGVYLVVIGVTLKILFTLMDTSENAGATPSTERAAESPSGT